MVSLKRERGWADTAHTTELQRACLTRFPSSVVSSVSDDRAGDGVGPLALRSRPPMGVFVRVGASAPGTDIPHEDPFRGQPAALGRLHSASWT